VNGKPACAAERLYGVPYSESLWDDPAGAYEQQIEPYSDEHDRRPVVIEEWTVHPPCYHLPTAAAVVDWLVEYASDQGELTEDAAQHLQDKSQDASITEAAESLLSALASRMAYRMADRRVAEHTITWDSEGRPLLDGQPLYRTSTKPDEASP
jgi:hypothetical protein